MSICEVCGKEHDGSFGSGRFCSRSCASKLGAIMKNKLYPKKHKKCKLVTKTCEKCGKLFTIDYNNRDARRRRFCSRSCANSHIHTIETKQKIKQSLHKTITNKLYDSNGNKHLSKKECIKKYNYKEVDVTLNIDLTINTCVICGKLFYHQNYRQTCSKNCYKILHRKNSDKLKNIKKVHYKTNKEWNEYSTLPIYKYYFTYKITNLINNKYYLGIHMTNNLNDGYLGSGVAIRKAIKKYGKQNFKKDILEYYSCYKDLAIAETKLITETVVNDPLSYNLTLGGIGGPAFKGKHHSKETKQKLKEIRKQQIQKTIKN